ncbi:hypothetical protein HY745_08785 [Candidatus Desantisbacteria bacterium]|nr:hypothetical protein [Candidatus Desantisbacteria bacterium]
MEREKESHLKSIIEVMGDLKCEKKFICAESGFENLCKSKKVFKKNLLVCLECNNKKKIKICNFIKLTIKGYICTCPLRIYIKENLGK